MKWGEAIMAIELRPVFYATRERYKMSLLAGSDAIDNMFNWVYTIERIDYLDDLYGDELLITTCAFVTDEKSLFQFVKKIIDYPRVEFAGLIIMTGGNIDHIPQKIIDLCNAANLPLFVIPWEIHLVDLLRDYISRLFMTEKLSFSLMGGIKNAIFEPNNKDAYASQLERNSFSLDAQSTVILLRSQHVNFLDLDFKDYEIFRSRLETAVHKHHLIACIFEYQDYFFIVCNQVVQSDFEDFIETLVELVNHRFETWHLHVGISDYVESIYQLSLAYKQAMNAIDSTFKSGNLPIHRYEATSINKLFLAIEDTQLLNDIHDEILAPLIEYDEENDANLTETLHIYLSNNSSLIKTSEIMYTHRNTVQYRLKKIREILNVDFNSSDQKFKLLLAFYIQQGL